jgi:hypothetical protein
MDTGSGTVMGGAVVVVVVGWVVVVVGWLVVVVGSRSSELQIHCSGASFAQSVRGKPSQSCLKPFRALERLAHGPEVHSWGSVVVGRVVVGLVVGGSVVVGLVVGGSVVVGLVVGGSVVVGLVVGGRVVVALVVGGRVVEGLVVWGWVVGASVVVGAAAVRAVGRVAAAARFAVLLGEGAAATIVRTSVVGVPTVVVGAAVEEDRGESVDGDRRVVVVSASTGSAGSATASIRSEPRLSSTIGTLATSTAVKMYTSALRWPRCQRSDCWYIEAPTPSLQYEARRVGQSLLLGISAQQKPTLCWRTALGECESKRVLRSEPG